MTAFLGTYRRTLLQLLVAVGVVGAPGASKPRETPRLPAQNVAYSPAPAAIALPTASDRIEPQPQWNGPTFVPTIMPGEPSDTSAPVSFDDSLAVPEPSVIVLLLGGAGLAMMTHRSRRSS